jgi:hypothetical protein
MNSGRGHPARPVAEAASERCQARRRGRPDDVLHPHQARKPAPGPLHAGERIKPPLALPHIAPAAYMRRSKIASHAARPSASPEPARRVHGVGPAEDRPDHLRSQAAANGSVGVVGSDSMATHSAAAANRTLPSLHAFPNPTGHSGQWKRSAHGAAQSGSASLGSYSITGNLLPL